MRRPLTLACLLSGVVGMAQAQERRWFWPLELSEPLSPEDASKAPEERVVFEWERTLAPEREVLDIALLPDGRLAILSEQGLDLADAAGERKETIAIAQGYWQVHLPTLLAIGLRKDGLRLRSLTGQGAEVTLPDSRFGVLLGRLTDGAIVCASIPKPTGEERGPVTLHLVRDAEVTTTPLATLLGEPADALALPLELAPDGGLLAAAFPAEGEASLHLFDLGALKPRWRATPGGMITGACMGPDRVVCATASDGVTREAILDAWLELRGRKVPPRGAGLLAFTRQEGKKLWHYEAPVLQHVLTAGSIEIVADPEEGSLLGVEPGGGEAWAAKCEPGAAAFQDHDGAVIITERSMQGGVRIDPASGRQLATVRVGQRERSRRAEPMALLAGERLVIRAGAQVFRRNVEKLLLEVSIPEAERKGRRDRLPSFPEALPGLERAFSSPDPKLRRTAARYALQNWWAREMKEVVPLLIARLDDEDRATRLRSTLALARHGAAGRPGLPRLVVGLSGQDPELRLAAAVALAAIDPQGEATDKAVEVLQSALAAETEPLSTDPRRALCALAHIPSQREKVVATLRARLLGSDPRLASEAANVVGEIGTDDVPEPAVAAALVPDLEKLKDHPELGEVAAETLERLREAR